MSYIYTVKSLSRELHFVVEHSVYDSYYRKNNFQTLRTSVLGTKSLFTLEFGLRCISSADWVKEQVSQGFTPSGLRSVCLTRDTCHSDGAKFTVLFKRHDTRRLQTKHRVWKGV